MWARLVNTSDEHFKFYAVEFRMEKGKRHLTGRVQFGRIGGRANEYKYAPSMAKSKFKSKLAKGYRFLNEAVVGAVFAEEVLVSEWC
jgi:hypothetical protein